MLQGRIQGSDLKKAVSAPDHFQAGLFQPGKVLLQFLHITAYAMDGFAFGAETLVGQAMGARRRAALRRADGRDVAAGARADYVHVIRCHVSDPFV